MSAAKPDDVVKAFAERLDNQRIDDSVWFPRSLAEAVLARLKEEEALDSRLHRAISNANANDRNLATTVLNLSQQTNEIYDHLLWIVRKLREHAETINEHAGVIREHDKVLYPDEETGPP